MDNLIIQDFPFFFPVFFVLMWLAITIILGFLSGWYSLMKKYPNQEDEPILQLKRQSGSMALGVSMSGILNLGVCPSGLRIGMMRIFGIFSREFFVAWEEIMAER